MEKPPIVDSSAIRPAGHPEQCFYCHQEIGQPHLSNCVLWERRVMMRFSFAVEIEVPHCWDKESIEFQYNESSFCADNAIQYIEEWKNRVDGHLPKRTAAGLTLDDEWGPKQCLCGYFHADYLGEVDTDIEKDEA